MIATQKFAKTLAKDLPFEIQQRKGMKTAQNRFQILYGTISISMGCADSFKSRLTNSL
jgi:beta-glucanase (GH16 family)